MQRENDRMSMFSILSRRQDPRVVLDPLIEQIRYYDSLRLSLERLGGDASKLNQIAEALAKEVLILDGFGDELRVSLVRPDLLHQMLFRIGQFEVRLSIRQTDAGMPVYYLCQIHQDFWAEYSLIVEDLYRSPGYPSIDDRFVKLMTGGHEHYYLCLSPFRRGVLKLLLNQNEASEEKVDEMLYKAGRHIYQAAWHEDQLPAVLCAQHFAMPRFRQAIELLYVCLSAELCDLRAVIDEHFLQFFTKVDCQPAIAGLLSLLSGMDGSAMNKIPEKALKLYCKLNKAFSRFLKMEVHWGERRLRVPLYKLVFANFSRLNLLRSSLTTSDSLGQAATLLEMEASSIIGEIVKC